MKQYLRLLKKKRLPTTWCPGCGIGIAVKALAKSMYELKLSRKNTVIISGIGCTGRSAGYFNLDTVHTLHGRAVAVAEGIKFANPKLNVIVLSGDGDIAGIGGNHLLHSSRRKTPIKIICVNNNIYGMTGGQVSPTTPLEKTTMSTPEGNQYPPIDMQCLANDNYYARSTVFHVKHLKNMIKAAIEYKDFALVEVVSNCYQNFGKKNGFTHPYEMLMYFKDNFKIKSAPGILKKGELGSTK